ncbi:MAG: class I SAM-dependent methyltransferase [Wenzhouxiangella sp.]|jgi:SAM-dependent methyltransferase|nr:class I SAM-dependent methyltransferase [Wenzhouxiangella sp.]
MPEDKQPAVLVDHWSAYWARGALTSLPDDFASNYDGEIAEFWFAEFARLPDPSAILDACTGNGALAFLAAAYAQDHKRDIAVTAVDAARIDPQKAVASNTRLKDLPARINFIAGTPIEQFSAEANSFDLVASQYGLEYCDSELAAGRLVNLIKPKGRLVMLAHALESDMFTTMRAEAAEYERLDELKIGLLLRSWLSGQLGSPDLRRRLQRSGDALADDYRRHPSDLFRYVLLMIRHVVRADEAELKRSRPALQDTSDQLRAGQSRLADMLAANGRLADPAWYQPYLDAGLVLTADGGLTYQQQHHVGHYYAFVKPA